jgi:hypothetical protein
MYAKTTVKDILETAIDSLIDNFAREPYIHRCEHSIHCELYNMLTVHRALQGLYPLKGDGKRSTALVHKEWPETIPRPEKQGRRGNFDLAILDPEHIPNHTVQDFTAGLIPPAFIVEIGLNYGLDHLRNDDVKMVNSGYSSNGYLVHLWQPHKGIPAKDMRDLQDWLPKVRSCVAAVVFTSSGPMVKHLKESAFTLTIKEEMES